MIVLIFFLFWHTFLREQLEAGNAGCTTVAHVWRWQWGESWSLSLPWTGESRSLQTCKKNVTRAWRRENLKWKLSGGGYTELKGVHEKYNNLQLLVLMLFQNMLLQSLGKMGVMSLWYHTHIPEGKIKPHFLTLNLTYKTISLGIKQKLKWSTICFRPSHCWLNYWKPSDSLRKRPKSWNRHSLPVRENVASFPSSLLRGESLVNVGENAGTYHQWIFMFLVQPKRLQLPERLEREGEALGHHSSHWYILNARLTGIRCPSTLVYLSDSPGWARFLVTCLSVRLWGGRRTCEPHPLFCTAMHLKF